MANYTILLIDYEPRSIERFRDPLLAAGYSVEIATDGISGIEAFHRLNPDMVLVEAMIPKKHGFEVCQELKRTPHGRRTPVLITTGVYKGRKYRTQALHIYGCDEYIEKPIAPEQLLEIVGKFFGSGAAAPSPSPLPAATAPQAEPSTAKQQGGVPPAKGAGHTEASQPKIERGKSATTPKTISDDTEDEIMARLDAILPNFGVVPKAEAMPIALESWPETDGDPFATMRSELDAELGSLSAALAVELDPDVEVESAGLVDTGDAMEAIDAAESIESVETIDSIEILANSDPMPSDQQASPSVLESLPAPELAAAAPAFVPETPAAPVEKPGQVVSFDTKRSRKNKKSGKGNKPRGEATAEVATRAAGAALSPSELSRLVDTAPKSRTVVPTRPPVPAQRGVSAWVWAGVAVVAVGAAYFAITRGTGLQLASFPVPPPVSEAARSAPVENAPAAEPQTPAIVGDPGPTQAPTSAPPPRLTEVKPPAPTPPKSTAAKKTEDARASTAAPGIKAWKPEAKAAAKIPPPVISAPVEAEGSVAGLETVAAVAPSAPVPDVAPGTLVDIDEADTLPVSLQRKLPSYSLQARQMRIAGTVVMSLLVNEHGIVDRVVLISGVPGADVNDSAIRAAMDWTYRPATKQGVPVKVWTSERIVFKP